MKRMICPECKKTRSQGKFCLDCGLPLKEVITEETNFKPIRTNRSPSKLKEDVRNWLGRIGVQQPDIKIYANAVEAEITYLLKGSSYNFRSDRQSGEAENLAAVEQFLHYRVLGIERGIETEEKAFAGYESLPDYSEGMDPYQILGFQGKVDIETARKRFKQQSKKYHPDLNKDKETHKEFIKLKQAMEEIEKTQ